MPGSHARGEERRGRGRRVRLAVRARGVPRRRPGRPACARMRMRLGMPDASGRQSVEPMRGQRLHASRPTWSSRRWASIPRTCRGCSAQPELAVTRWGTLKIDHRTLHDHACPACSPPATSCAARAWWSGRSATAATPPPQMHDWIMQAKAHGRWPRRRRGVSAMTDFVADWNANVARLAGTYDPSPGARCLRRRPGRRARRQAAPRRGAGRHRCAEGGLASRRGRCRRQDRRRRRHPCRDPAGFLRRARSSAAATSCAPGRIAVGMVFLPQDRSRRAGALPRDRRDRDPATSATPSMAGARCRSTSPCIGEKANATRPEIEQIMIRNARGTDERDVRARPLRHPPPHREARRSRRRSADFYICSLSCRSIIYKGMFLAEQPDGLLSRPARRALRHRASRSSTSAIRPTPSRPGGWRSRSACSRITARSTRCAATSTG